MGLGSLFWIALHPTCRFGEVLLESVSFRLDQLHCVHLVSSTIRHTNTVRFQCKCCTGRIVAKVDPLAQLLNTLRWPEINLSQGFSFHRDWPVEGYKCLGRRPRGWSGRFLQNHPPENNRAVGSRRDLLRSLAFCKSIGTDKRKRQLLLRAARSAPKSNKAKRTQRILRQFW